MRTLASVVEQQLDQRVLPGRGGGNDEKASGGIVGFRTSMAWNTNFMLIRLTFARSHPRLAAYYQSLYTEVHHENQDCRCVALACLSSVASPNEPRRSAAGMLVATSASPGPT